MFRPFPTYRYGTLHVAEYKRGHHPNPSLTHFGKVPAWNKGLKKGDHPALDRMGFQDGHAPHNDWDHVNEKLRTDPELRARWLASKKGQIAWNAGLTAETNPDQVPKGENHWNWRGNPGGIRETHEYNALRALIFKRDDYTCQECGDRGGKGRGMSVRLHMHHIEPVSHNRDRVLDPTNVVTLCEDCHRKTDTFGPAALKKLRASSKRQ